MKRVAAILWLFLLSGLFFACKSKTVVPSKESINQLALKRGDLVSCGSPEKQFGVADFVMTCDPKSKKDFNLAVELLHSFEYDEAEKVFAKIIDETPDCAMAYWGVAMSNFHPLWTPPTKAELWKGLAAIKIANSIENKSPREAAYINAIGSFYKDWDKIDHLNRCVQFEKEMERLHKNYPADTEATIFYALALDAAADPADKTYKNQKKAGELLTNLYKAMPNHPGIIHYIIHTYDYPELAAMGLSASREYARVAPSSAHALHMPSHITTRLGLWDECIQSNLQSIAAAKCYAEAASIKGHWDEELHGLDYLVYAYLQKGENKMAEKQLVYLKSITEVYPVNFKVAYAFASIPSRYVLENKKWAEASHVKAYPANFPWDKFPWQEAIIHFARALGSIHTGRLDAAKSELDKMKTLRDTLAKQKDNYKSNQVDIQIKSIEAWIKFTSADKPAAIQLMQLAADREDSTEKHPVTPGEVIPARELLGDMLLTAGNYDKALSAYESVLQKAPNRFNSLHGAGLAASYLKDNQKAISYYKQLVSNAGIKNAERPELISAKSFLEDHRAHL